MKIAVIGATGQAGSLITEKLVAAGADVTALVTNTSRLKVDVPVIEKDIFAKMEFRPVISPELKTMDERLFRPELMKLTLKK